MSMEYLNNRIKDALKMSGGNRAKARQQLIAWTFEDSKLLHTLAKPHLSGIVAYNVERVASGRADAAAKKATEATKTPKQEAAPQGKKPASNEEQFGMEILKAVAGSPQIFGLEDPGAPQKRGGVSQKHLDAINAIINKSAKKSSE